MQINYQQSVTAWNHSMYLQKKSQAKEIMAWHLNIFMKFISFPSSP
jgi:hypothetical protein